MTSVCREPSNGTFSDSRGKSNKIYSPFDFYLGQKLPIIISQFKAAKEITLRWVTQVVPLGGAVCLSGFRLYACEEGYWLELRGRQIDAAACVLGLY